MKKAGNGKPARQQPKGGKSATLIELDMSQMKAGFAGSAMRRRRTQHPRRDIVAFYFHNSGKPDGVLIVNRTLWEKMKKQGDELLKNLSLPTQ
jgi:hypothetical protein